MNFELRIMNYELKITDRRDIYRSYELQVTSYELQVTLTLTLTLTQTIIQLFNYLISN